MSKVVRVKVIQTNAVRTMTDTVAERLVKAMPNQYVILESPTIEVVKLAPVQKKSVEVVADKPIDIGNVPPRLVSEQTATTQTTESVLQEFDKPKRGRPFKT